MLIFFQLVWIDLLTRFFGLRRLRLVTVLVLAALLLRLANEYYDYNVHLCVQFDYTFYNIAVSFPFDLNHIIKLVFDLTVNPY